MYNNDVTYSDKWKTKENEEAYAKLADKYFDRSYASPSCPVAWAPEVLELMETLDKELGIERNTATMRAYAVQGNPFTWFVTHPIRNLVNSFKDEFFGPLKTWRKKNTVIDKVHHMAEAFCNPFRYGARAIRINNINPIINKIVKPKLRLSQLKEKYGELRIYFSAPPAFEEWVEQEVRKCELKLAMKGAYYPVESFWDSGVSYSVGIESTPDTITTEQGTYSDGTPYTKVTKTQYRGAMKELGLDLKEIEMKAMLAASKKEQLP